MELNKEKNKTTISVNLKRRQGTDNTGKPLCTCK